MLEFLQKIWKNHLLYQDLDSKFNDPKLLDTAELAILLSTNDQNYERYLHLNDFINILKKASLRTNLFSIQLAQIQAINALKMGFVSKNELLKALNLLSKLGTQETTINFIKSLELNEPNKKGEFFASYDKLNELNERMQALSEDEDLIQRLKEILQKFTQEKFIISITGVMNSGKSSVLNALLKSPVLGISNIPETANLTLLNYGQSNTARLHFWSQKEWQELVDGVKNDEKMSTQIKQIQEQEAFDEYILPKPLIKEIPSQDLKKFSSAQNSLSLLIKQIELYTKLDFLSSNISIVDTPGLDDVFIQREMLTKNFIKESDFLIHLMSASQSLSQKDSEFIISCLLDSRITKFLILISKADLLSEKELNEVISYTQNTLKKRLKDSGFDESFIEKIDFLTVSAKKASDFYEKKEDEKSLKESKILELESYLYKELFSGQKSTLILASYKKELLLINKELISRYETQNLALQDQSNNLGEENEILLRQSKQEEELLKQAKADINDFIFKLKDENVLATNTLQLLSKKLEDRLFDELKYSLEKKIKIDKIRLVAIFDRSFKDETVDILRELNYKGAKKFELLKENLALKYEFLQENLENDLENFKERLSENLRLFFDDERYELLKLELGAILESKNELEFLRAKIKELMDAYFQHFDLNELANKLDINKDFMSFLQAKLKRYEELQKARISDLKKMLSKGANEGINAKELLEKNLEKINTLRSLQGALLNAT